MQRGVLALHLRIGMLMSREALEDDGEVIWLDISFHA